MIFDAGNLFLDKKAITNYGTTPAASDNVVCNTGGGVAEEACWLAVLITGAASAGGNLTIELQHDTVAAMSSAATVASFTVPTGSQGLVVAARLPIGLKPYLRLYLTGSASMTGDAVVTAGLVADVDIKAV